MKLYAKIPAVRFSKNILEALLTDSDCKHIASEADFVELEVMESRRGEPDPGFTHGKLTCVGVLIPDGACVFTPADGVELTIK